jgi:hypothetical protein
MDTELLAGVVVPLRLDGVDSSDIGLSRKE